MPLVLHILQITTLLQCIEDNIFPRLWDGQCQNASTAKTWSLLQPRVMSTLSEVSCIRFVCYTNDYTHFLKISQILTSHKPYYEVRCRSKVSIEILNGNKPLWSHDTHIVDCHWFFMQKCWSVPGNHPSAAEVLHFSQLEVEFLTT